MKAAIDKINEVFSHDIQTSLVVPTLHDARIKVCKETLKKMEKEFYGIVADPIRINSKLKEAPASQKSIFEYAKSSNGAKDYTKLVDQVLQSSSNGTSVSRQLEQANGKVMYRIPAE